MVSNTPSVRQAAIASLALFAGYAEAADKYFEFPSCVLSCIRADACNGNTKCMCSSARITNFLDKVVTCAVPGCASSSRAVSMKTQFLDVMDDGCDALRMGIPKDKLKAAEKLAASLVAKLPPPTPVRPDPTQNPPSPTKGPPVQSPPSPPPATDIDDEPTPQPTTSRDRGGGGGGGGSSSSPATKVPDTVVPPQPTDTPAQPPPAGVTTYPPPAQTPTQAPPPPPPPPAGNGRRPDPTDSTPFALPINTAPSLSVSSWLLAGLVGVAALWL